jgi:hypothetical protein
MCHCKEESNQKKVHLIGRGKGTKAAHVFTKSFELFGITQSNPNRVNPNTSLNYWFTYILQRKKGKIHTIYFPNTHYVLHITKKKKKNQSGGVHMCREGGTIPWQRHLGCNQATQGCCDTRPDMSPHHFPLRQH